MDQRIPELDPVVTAAQSDRYIVRQSGDTRDKYVETSVLQLALQITESQITDLQAYLTAEVNDLTAAVTWDDIPDTNVPASAVTQHVGAIDHDSLLNFLASEHFTQAAISITESQISDLQSYGFGDVTKVSTPVNNQVGVWTGDGTLEGTTALTFDGTILSLASGRVRVSLGAVATPSVAIGAVGTGFYGDGTTHTGWVEGGTEYWRFDDASFQSLGVGTGLGQGPLLFNRVPTAVLPTLCPGRDDLSTGVGRFAIGSPSLIGGGVEMARGVAAAAGGLLANNTLTGGGLERVLTASDITGGVGNVFKVGTPVDNQIGIWTGDGTLEGTTAFTLNPGVSIDTTLRYRAAFGSLGAPVFSFTGETNSGMYRQSAGVLGFSMLGSNTWFMRTTHFHANLANGPAMVAEAPSATNAVFAQDFQDLTSGLGGISGFPALIGSGVTLAETIAAASGGLRVNNTLTGAGLERVLTTADIVVPDEVFPEFQFFADQLENPVNADWTVNALAPAVADSNNAGLSVRLFDDTTEEGVGFTIEVPANATNIVFDFVARAETAPGIVNTVGLDIYNRGIPDNAAVQAWSSATALADLDIPTNEFFQEDSESVSLATLGVTAGETTQFELVRTLPGAGTDLTGDWDLLLVKVSFT